jgi:hypothetical protein
MTSSFDHLVVSVHRGKSPAELMEAPPHALKGVSAADAEHLRIAFGIDTVGDLAANPFIQRAQAIAAAATGNPGFDGGPPPPWVARFGAAPLAEYESRPQVFRVDFGPVFYRGRLDGTARMLVVGQDPSVNEILAQRAFVGQSGQRLQGFLAKLGIVRSYVMLNTFLYSIFGQFGGINASLSRQDPMLGYRNSLFDAVAAGNPLQAILTVGSAARDAVDRWPGASAIPRAHILHPAFPNTGQLLADWNQARATLTSLVDPDDAAVVQAAYGVSFAPGEVASIPRRDLPFGLPRWHGDGDHAVRSGDAVIEWHAQGV